MDEKNSMPGFPQAGGESRRREMVLRNSFRGLAEQVPSLERKR